MKPGLNMDCMVAEKVMGCHTKKNHKGLFDLVIPGGVNSVDWRRESMTWMGCPDYSTDIKAAWDVVEKIKHLKPDGERERFFEMGWTADGWWVGWGVSAGIGGYSFYTSIIADTAPEAICLAALKSVGVDVSRI